MPTIHFATTNKGKLASIQSVLSQYAIEVIHHDIDLPEPRTYDLQEIAKQKAKKAYAIIQKPVIALDSGFYIYALNGFPRSFVNFVLETIGIDGILRLAQGKGRECEFKNCLAYDDGTMREPMLFESSVKGVLAGKPRGKGPKDYFWSALFFIFIPSGKDKTLAEMTREEYEQWRKERHDDSYANQFAEWFLARHR